MSKFILEYPIVFQHYMMYLYMVLDIATFCTLTMYGNNQPEKQAVTQFTNNDTKG